MSGQTDYTPEEWTKLIQMPLAVAGVVIFAAPNSIGVVGEIVAAGKAIEDLQESSTASDLLKSLSASMEAEYEKVSTQERGSEPSTLAGVNFKNRANSKDQLIEACREVSATLASKATPEEADEYKQLLMKVANDVANSAKEGSFMGIGGTRVTAAEQAVINDVASALGVSA